VVLTLAGKFLNFMHIFILLCVGHTSNEGTTKCSDGVDIDEGGDIEIYEVDVGNNAENSLDEPTCLLEVNDYRSSYLSYILITCNYVWIRMYLI
jgi:hypothetical protein